MKRRLAWVCAIAMLIGGVATASAGTQRFALVIGNNEAPANAPKGYGTLRYADDDAVRWSRLLRRTRADVTLLAVLDAETQRRYPTEARHSRPPRLDNLLAAVARIKKSVAVARSRGDTTIVYLTYSGHGAHDEAGLAYLALLSGRLTQKALYDQVLAPLGADYIHLIVDACHAGGVVGIRGPGGEVSAATVQLSPADIARASTHNSLKKFPHVGVIVATSPDQETHEWSRLESGIFTHEVLSAISGAADVNGDGAIEYTEIQAYAAAANRGLADPRAVPRVLARAPAQRRNLPLLKLAELTNTAFLVGQAERLGRFHVELDTGQRLLDAHLASRARSRLAIPAGSHAWLITKRRQANLGRLKPGQLVSIDKLRFVTRTRRPRGAVDAALRKGLFSVRYGRAYYRGFVDSGSLIGVRFDVPQLRLPGNAAPPERVIDWKAPRRKRQLSGLGLAFAAVAASSGVLALNARSESKDGSALDQDEARRRFRVYGWISVTASVAAVAAGFASWRWGGRGTVRVTPPGPAGSPAKISFTAPF